MASEAQAVDVAQKPTPAYQDTIKAYILQQSQPASFWEHDAAGTIPFIGPLLHSLALEKRQARVNTSAQNLGLFDTYVQQGKLPDGAEGQQIATQLGIPDAVLKAGIMESQKVRSTLGYQSRRLFEQAMPSWNQPAHYGMFPAEGGEYATPEAARTGFAQAEQANKDQNAQAFKGYVRGPCICHA